MPLPVGFPGLMTTSRDWMRPSLTLCSLCRALSAAMLNSSDPQNRMRRGSDCFCARCAVVEKHAPGKARGHILG